MYIIKKPGGRFNKYMHAHAQKLTKFTPHAHLVDHLSDFSLVMVGDTVGSIVGGHSAADDTVEDDTSADYTA